LTVKDPNTGKKKVSRIPLEAEENGVKRPVASVAEAGAAMGKLKVQRAENTLPVLGQMPKFSDYVEEAYVLCKRNISSKDFTTVS
jgi:hypothetical protein